MYKLRQLVIHSLKVFQFRVHLPHTHMRHRDLNPQPSDLSLPYISLVYHFMTIGSQYSRGLAEAAKTVL